MPKKKTKSSIKPAHSEAITHPVMAASAAASDIPTKMIYVDPKQAASIEALFALAKISQNPSSKPFPTNQADTKILKEENSKSKIDGLAAGSVLAAQGGVATKNTAKIHTLFAVPPVTNVPYCKNLFAKLRR